MRTVNVHAPLKLRLTGEPTKDQWQALEEVLSRRYRRALRAQLLRLAAEPSDAPAPAELPARSDLYLIPSFQSGGVPQPVPVVSGGVVALLRATRDPFDEFSIEGRSWWLIADGFPGMPSVDQMRAVMVGHDALTVAILAQTTATFIRRAPSRYSYWSFRHPRLGVVARAYANRTDPTSPRSEYGVYMFITDAEGERMLTGADAAGAPGAGREGPQLTPGQATLIDLYNRRFPSTEPGQTAGPLDLTQKIRLALDLADKTFFGEVGEAAARAIRDPTFIVTTVLIIGFYVFLWLSPDPTLLTKAVAGALTIYLLYNFTIHDIIGFATAWLALADACSAARTENDLRSAGDEFLQAIGPIGFDLLLMIAFWAVGRTVAPRVRAGATRRGIAAAEAQVATTTEAPGSGVNPRALETPSRVVAEARTAAANPTSSTSVLDALARRLPDAARRGLEAQRAKFRRGHRGQEISADEADGRVLGILESMRIDPLRQLSEWGMGKPEFAAAGARLLEARARLARLRLIEAGVTQEPAVRRRVGQEAARETPALERARAAVRELVLELQRVSPEVRAQFERADVESIVSAIAEAMARADLRGAYEALRVPGIRIFSNLRLGQRIPGYRSIEAWAVDNPGTETNGFSMYRGELYRVLGEVDNMVTVRAANGRMRILELEETKSGAEEASGAREQVSRAHQILQEIGSATGTRASARVFEGGTRRQLGNDVTGVFELTDLSALVESPLGRTGFTRSLPFDRATLERVVQELLSTRPGLPAQPRTVLLPTSPRAPDAQPDAGSPDPRGAGLPGGVPEPGHPPRRVPDPGSVPQGDIPGGVPDNPDAGTQR
jgi:hypothetical protein